MRTLFFSTVFLFGSLVAAIGETIEFKSDDDVVIVRTVDMFGSAKTEFIGVPGQYYQCVAFDENEEPLGVTTATTEIGAIFQELAATSVAKVVCRKV